MKVGEKGIEIEERVDVCLGCESDAFGPPSLRHRQDAGGVLLAEPDARPRFDERPSGLDRDSDSDGLTDAFEKLAGTNRLSGDTDADGLTDAYEAALLTYPGLQNARNLVSSREQQRQDWIVYTAVFTFIAAVDAYVTAHLKDFPADLSTSRASDGGVSIGVSLPVPIRR